MIKINITEDFAESTGGRYKKNGPYSGEEFRDTILLKKVKEAINKKETIEVNFDGGYGHGSSFLDESFGGTIDRLNKDEAEYLLNNLTIISNDNPRKVKETFEYMREHIKNK